MSIHKTSLVSKIVFWPMIVVSTVFTVTLFYDFGSSVFTSILWSVVGITLEFLKILFLFKWQNAVFLRRPAKMNHVGMYLSLAALSVFASLVFGISTIEKQSMGIDAKHGQVTELAMRIKDAEERLSKYQPPNAEAERRSIDRQIDSLTRQITNITESISERSLQITREIQRLQTIRNQAGNGIDPQKDSLITSIASMRREYAIASKGGVSAKGSFETLADVLGVSVNSIMACFLLFTVIAIEIGMAVTAGSATAGSPVVGKKKKKSTNQLSFTDMIEQKEN
jgi:TolA-binding protein